jgi:DNA-directed RNA polymerase subunit M/transcription elongation factor TFIIS
MTTQAAEYAAEFLLPAQLRLQAQGLLRTELGLSLQSATCVDDVLHQLTEGGGGKTERERKRIEARGYQRNYVDQLFEFVILYTRFVETKLGDPLQTALRALQTTQGWESPLYDEFLEIERRNVRNLCKPLEVVEGLFTCAGCGSNKTHSYSRQMRSADEPMTTFVTCANKACGKKWKIN